MRFYDCGDDDEDCDGAQASQTIDVDRVYTLDWDEFDEACWDRLMQVYRGLPGWQPHQALPCWFGMPEAVPSLAASVEPPGLHLFGVLPRGWLQSWHEAFLAATADLPWRGPASGEA